MKNWTKALAAGLAIALAAPGFAADRDDAKDTVTEKEHGAKRTLRDAKPGDKSAEDRWNDAKDASKQNAAKARKSGRRATRKMKSEVHESTR